MFSPMWNVTAVQVQANVQQNESNFYLNQTEMISFLFLDTDSLNDWCSLKD